MYSVGHIRPRRNSSITLDIDTPVCYNIIMEYEDYLEEQAEEIMSRTEFVPTVSDDEWYEGVANS
jgi:hypothetical protein